MRLLLLLIFAASTAFGLTPEEKELVLQMRESVSALRSKLISAQKSNSASLSALAQAAEQTQELNAQLKDAAEQSAALAADRDRIASELAVAEVRYEKLNRRYQTAQLIIALTTAFAVGMIVLQFTHSLQPPYGFLVPIGAGVAAFFAIYIIL
jgi:septal ring factor EnvC (AmiA/AmiB activator)